MITARTPSSVPSRPTRSDPKIELVGDRGTGSIAPETRAKPRSVKRRPVFWHRQFGLTQLMAVCLLSVSAGLFLTPNLGRSAILWTAFGLLIAGQVLLVALFIRNRRGIRIGDRNPNLSLSEKNQLLAQRLESLEDQSWEVRESEEIHRSLAEAFGDVVVHRHRNGDLLFANPHFHFYFDDDHELPGIPAPSMETPEPGSIDAPAPLQTREIEIETRQGRRWFSWTDLLIRDPVSGETGMRSVGRDITERMENQTALIKALDKAEAANQTKSRFLAMVSHEIRTPLNGIIGMSQLLDDTKMDPAQKSYVEAISTSSHALLGMVEDLLDSARIEAGKMVLHPKPVHLRRLIEDVADIISPRSRTKELDLATFVAADVPDVVRADADRLRQVLLNLAGNAVKFTESGGVAISAEVQTKTSDKVVVRFEVRDTGPGLTSLDQESIFADFAQASTGTTRSHEGAGLGLSISRQLVELMHGQIGVISEPGAGSCFYVEIPFQTVSDERSLQEASGKGTVRLLLRDTPARDALLQSIAVHGYKAKSVSRIQDVKRIKDGAVSALIADQALLSEEKLLVELKRLRDSGCRIYSLGDANDGKSDACDGWLTWPVRSQTLKKVLARSVKKAGTENNTSGETPAENNAQSLNVLVAEDNPINATLVKALLSQLGHEVTHVENGRGATDAVNDVLKDQETPYDVTFMDLHMPVLDGIGAIAEIRRAEARAGAERMPIVVLSADGQTEAREKALAAGADDFLVKPLDLDAVAGLLNSLKS